VQAPVFDFVSRLGSQGDGMKKTLSFLAPVQLWSFVFSEGAVLRDLDSVTSTPPLTPTAARAGDYASLLGHLQLLQVETDLRLWPFRDPPLEPDANDGRGSSGGRDELPGARARTRRRWGELPRARGRGDSGRGGAPSRFALRSLRSEMERTGRERREE
jgi:hypothetical protein